eukprot:6719541-Heterocapsa_arctica.AAC.1
MRATTRPTCTELRRSHCGGRRRTAPCPWSTNHRASFESPSHAHSKSTQGFVALEGVTADTTPGPSA